MMNALFVLGLLLPLSLGDSFGKRFSEVHGQRFSEVHELTALNFDKTAEPKSAWLILFYAPWCGHCKKMAPDFERLAEHYHRASPQRVHIGRVDATQHSGLATRFDIKGYPTLVLLRGGERLADYSGERTFDALSQFVDEQLSLPPSAPRPASPKTGAPAARAKNPKNGAAAYYLHAKEALSWVTDDPFRFAGCCLATAVVIGGSFILALFVTTTPSPR